MKEGTRPFNDFVDKQCKKVIDNQPGKLGKIGRTDGDERKLSKTR